MARMIQMLRRKRRLLLRWEHWLIQQHVTDVTLNLISDNPTVTSVAADKLSISENADDGNVSTITATIDNAHSKNVIIPFKNSGTSIIESDYTTSFYQKNQKQQQV